MLVYLVIWALRSISVDSTVLHQTHNVEQTSNSHYLIVESLKYDDFTDTGENEETVRLEKGSDFKRKPAKAILNLEKEMYNEIGVFTQLIKETTRRSPRKRDVTNTGADYNYDNLLNEYHEEAIFETRSNLTYHFNNRDTSETGIVNVMQKLFGVDKNCSEGDVGFKAIKCLINDYKTQKEPLAACLIRLWKILRIWFFVYLILAIPLWCTRGLCCCFLFCKFFKPQKTIEEAKRYLIMNPPGLLKPTKGHEILYEPTKSERDSYEEFEHLLRTI